MTRDDQVIHNKLLDLLEKLGIPRNMHRQWYWDPTTMKQEVRWRCVFSVIE